MGNFKVKKDSTDELSTEKYFFGFPIQTQKIILVLETYGPKVFIFVKNFEVCLFSMNSRHQKETMGTFLTLENKKHYGFLHFNIKFTKFKTFYQKSVMRRFLGYIQSF